MPKPTEYTVTELAEQSPEKVEQLVDTDLKLLVHYKNEFKESHREEDIAMIQDIEARLSNSGPVILPALREHILVNTVENLDPEEQFELENIY
jgi:hypothetical protein